MSRTRHSEDLSSAVLATEINEWYPQGLQIILHIRSSGLQDYRGGVFWSKLWSFQI